MAEQSCLSLIELLEMSDDELARCDIAEMNLACAVRLPGAEEVDIPACLRRLDRWTDRVREGTNNAIRNWARYPMYRDYSEARYRITTMVIVLQRHLGLTYNHAFMERPYDGSNSRDLFIHAVLMEGHPAICCTAPVICAAIGRRLGYPIKLVKAKEHLFCRWDDPNGERFNIEASGPGFWFYSDEYYRTWPKPILPGPVEIGWMLKSLTPREELALFLNLRGTCWLENLQTVAAIDTLSRSCRLDPKDGGAEYNWAVATILHRAVQEMKKQDFRLSSSMLSMPAPRQGWEILFYPLAQKELNRILSNRRAQYRAAQDRVLREQDT